MQCVRSAYVYPGTWVPRRTGAGIGKGDIMGSDYSALFYVLVGIILIVKFYVGSCGCG